MSSEIVPVLDGTPKGLALEHEDIRAFELLNLRSSGTSGLSVDLVGGDYQIKQFLASDRGHKYVTQFNPVQSSVKPLLDKIKEPSVLLLRGCDQLLLKPTDFPFAKFKALTALEISSVSNLTTLPEKEISRMVHLQSLNLSHLPIQQLHDDDLFSNLTNLRTLILRGCSHLRSLPKLPTILTAFQCLDLSHLPIETLPLDSFDMFRELRWLLLKGCCKLSFLPSLHPLRKLEVLDLSRCTALQELEPSLDSGCCSLLSLDLSYTTLDCKPFLRNSSHHLTHLYLREVNEIEFYSHLYPSQLQVLDLSGAKEVNAFDFLHYNHEGLEALDLSRTGIEYLGFIFGPLKLRYLILRECTSLVQLPAMERLTSLEVLDISGCEILGDLPEDLCYLRNLKELNLSGCSCLRELREGVFDEMSILEKLDLSKTNISHLPSFANLTSLTSLNLSLTPVTKVPDFSHLVNLQELVLPADHCNKVKDQMRRMGHHQGSISKPNELHLVSTFRSNSGFDRFKYGFKMLNRFISSIKDPKTPPLYLLFPFGSDGDDDDDDDSPTNPNATVDNFNIDTRIVDPSVSNHIQEEVFKRNFERMGSDLRYILGNIDLLESSDNCKSSNELLNELMDAATDLHPRNFPLDSNNLTELLRLVAKLKLLVPPKQVHPLEEDEEEKKKKKKPRFKTLIKEERKTDAEYMNAPRRTIDFDGLFKSLTDTERKCLLYFAGFPRSGSAPLKIKGRILIHLWYGEGFIGPQLEEDVSLNTVEEIGQRILMVLEEKRFIESEIIKCRGSGHFIMANFVHSFVRERAKEDSFFEIARVFEFRKWALKLTPYFAGSQRACLLKSDDNVPSSCVLWAKYCIESSEKLECFKGVRTLLNVDEPIVDIKAEWFSKMRDLRLLHLGSWGCENEDHVDVVDFNFLEELKNMKHLRLLSLEGFTAIMKLPDSICKLTHLKILNLRDCSYLEELPADIGSLKSLTHLDLTNCRLLAKLPKGVMSLSELEVLKGFLVTYEASGRQSRKACTFRDLLKLDKLRKVNLVVNKDSFPGSKDLEVLKEMKNLCNLKITWEMNDYVNQEPQDFIALRHSRWRKLNCWEQQTCRNDTEEPLGSDRLSNLKKLVLCCYRLETPPSWLHPSELQNLVRLYIVGGNLKTLLGDISQNTWNVRMLRMKYLRNLYMDWPILRAIFPQMEYLENHQCDKLTVYPFDREGVWMIQHEETKESWGL